MHTQTDALKCKHCEGGDRTCAAVRLGRTRSILLRPLRSVRRRACCAPSGDHHVWLHNPLTDTGSPNRLGWRSSNALWLARVHCHALVIAWQNLTPWSRWRMLDESATFTPCSSPSK